MRLRPGVVVVDVELRHAAVVRFMRNAGLTRTTDEELPKPSERSAVPLAEPRGSLWYEIADDHSVLEFRSPTVAGGPLALHVVIDTEADATIAWWETDSGMWIAHVGSS